MKRVTGGGLPARIWRRFMAVPRPSASPPNPFPARVSARPSREKEEKRGFLQRFLGLK